MPRLNAILMAGLAVATIATAGFLCFERMEDPKPGPVRVEPLLRKLADADPDLRREGEQALRALGPRAVAPLREAARSSDPVLSTRASRILRELEPAPPEAARAPESPEPETPEVLQFELRAQPHRVRAGESIVASVTLVNHGSQPVLLAGALRQWTYAPMGEFEVTDPKGRAFSLKAEVQVAGEALVASVKPGERFPLFGPAGYRAFQHGLPPGAYRLRFVYDASEGSLYRSLVLPSADGVPLPPLRLASNPVSIEVAE